jgi:predicted outer membrane protein
MAQSPTRRGLLSTAALAPLASIPAAHAATTNPDAELIVLCAEFDRLEIAYRASMYDGPAGTDKERAAEAEQTRINDAQRELAERMHTIRATTVAGHVARARSFVGWAPDMMEAHDGMEDLLRSAIFRDLTGQPVVPATMVLTSPPSTPERDEAIEYDTALIATCKQHIANHRAFNTAFDDPSTQEGDKEVLGSRYDQTRDAISDSEPRTLAGIYAKARAAKVEARSMGEVWAWDIVNDLLRIAGEAPV